MRNANLPPVSEYVDAAMHRLMDEAVEAGEPVNAIFAQGRLEETVQKVTEYTGFALDTPRQRRIAQRLCVYGVGRYMQDHRIESDQ